MRAPGRGVACARCHSRTRARAATPRRARRHPARAQRALAAAGRGVQHAVEPQHTVTVRSRGRPQSRPAREVVDLVDPAVRPRLRSVAMRSTKSWPELLVRRRSQLPKSRRCRPMSCRRAPPRGPRAAWTGHLARAPRRPNHRRARPQGHGLHHRSLLSHHHHLHPRPLRALAVVPRERGTTSNSILFLPDTNFSSRLRRPSNAFTSST